MISKENENPAFSPSKESPIRSYIKRIASEINSKENIEQDDEENELMQQSRKKSTSIATIQSSQRTVNNERKSSFC